MLTHQQASLLVSLCPAGSPFPFPPLTSTPALEAQEMPQEPPKLNLIGEGRVPFHSSISFSLEGWFYRETLPVREIDTYE